MIYVYVILIILVVILPFISMIVDIITKTNRDIRILTNALTELELVYINKTGYDPKSVDSVSKAHAVVIDKK